jgi:hypothetical protein
MVEGSKIVETNFSGKTALWDLSTFFPRDIFQISPKVPLLKLYFENLR